MPLSETTMTALSQERKELFNQLQEMEALKQRLQAIDVLLQSSNSTNGIGNTLFSDSKKNGSPKNDLNSEYDKGWVWEDKCFFVLREMGKAYSSQIADRILFYEPELKKTPELEKRARNKTNYIMSTMYRDSKVKKIGQTGKKYLFAP